MAFPKPNIATSSATFANLQANGLSGLLELLITVNNVATVAPTVAATLSESGSGGTLPAATYYVVITETNGIGETTAGPVSSGQAITLGEDLVVTFQSLKSGNTARNTYVGVASTGPFYLAATGTTASTVTFSAPLPTNSYAVQPPAVNTTGFTFVDASGNTDSTTLQLIRAAKTNRLQSVYDYAAKALSDWNHGDPMTTTAIRMKLEHAATAFAVISQALYDAGGLVDSNAGTLYPSTEGGVGTVAGVQRSWP